MRGIPWYQGSETGDTGPDPKMNLPWKMKDKHKKNVQGTADPAKAEADTAPAAVPVPCEGEAATAAGDPGKAEAVKADAGKAVAKESTEPHKKSDEKYLRLLADFDNFRKRTMKERSELCKRANEELIQEFLPVLDHLDLALASAGELNVDKSVLDGFRLVAEQMTSVLKKAGLSPIELNESHFDPAQHEAVAHLASETVPENGIIAEVRLGYMLGGKLLRPARVVVSSGPDRATAPAVENGKVPPEGVAEVPPPAGQSEGK